MIKSHSKFPWTTAATLSRPTSSSNNHHNKTNLKQWLVLLMGGTACFYSGLLVGSTLPCRACLDNADNNNNVNASIPLAAAECVVPSPKVKQEERAREAEQIKDTTFPPSIKNFLVDYATIPRDAFNQFFDIGVPYDETQATSKEVVLLYPSKATLPTGNSSLSSSLLSLDPITATEHCPQIKIILTEPVKRGPKAATESMCIALVPQWDSYSVHKYMRMGNEGHWHYVSRSHMSNGRSAKVPSQDAHTFPALKLLSDYVQHLDGIRSDLLSLLKPIVGEPKGSTSTPTVIVLVCNWGQAPLLHNFVCNARAKGLSVTNILVFATDAATYDLAKNKLQLTTYTSDALFGDMPEQAARVYGDRTFTKLMMAKVYVVQLVLSLGYHVLFQDVDVLWYKNPLDYFDHGISQEWDLIFQDDGARSVRYQPYSPNTGFYFVRHNERTVFFFNSLLKAGDLVHSTSSHQAALTALLNEHVSWKGLRVKVLNRGWTTPFPGGFEYHRQFDYMREWLLAERRKRKGETADDKAPDPYIFHMSWTQNKDNKLLYWKQMGEWYAHTSTASGQCLSEANITCFYRDKPSLYPCKSSPPIDKGKPSFWR